jgi:hypothetical protein
MEDFEKTIREMVEIRHRRERQQALTDSLNGEAEYTRFKCWCNAFKNGNGQTDAKVFAEYLKEESRELSFTAKKHLLEKYFGYEFEYNYEKHEWETHKRKPI